MNMNKYIQDLKHRAGITEGTILGKELQDFMFKIAGGDIGRDEAMEQIVKMAGNDPVRSIDLVLKLFDAAGSFPGMTYKLKMGLSKDRY